jgi:hypothetical protein
MLFMGIRRLAAVLMLAALVAGASTAFAVARHPATKRGTNTIVSQGTGRQVLEGAGLTYGTLAPGGVVRFIDLSLKHDAKYTVTAQIPASGSNAAQSIQVKPIKLAGGMLIFKFGKNPKQTARASLAFSVAGSRFRLALEGTSVLNGAAVVAKVALDGTGTIAVNGQNPPVDWLTAGRVTLTAHPLAPPKTTATTTTVTTTPPTTTS